MSSALAVELRGNALHFILYVKLQLFESDFFDQVFGIQEGRLREFKKFYFVLMVLLGETLVFGVPFENYVPRAPLRCCHAFLLTTEM
jgi:hypothetical protein